MCRNIRTLHNFEPPANEEEVQAAALQYVRKISGYTKPSQANAEAFERAVEGDRRLEPAAGRARHLRASQGPRGGGGQGAGAQRGPLRGRLASAAGVREARQFLGAGIAKDQVPEPAHLLGVSAGDVAQLAAVGPAVVEPQLLASISGDEQPAVVPALTYVL